MKLGRFGDWTANDVWAVGEAILSTPPGEAPFVMHYDGNSWTEVTGDTSRMPLGVFDIYGSGNTDDFWVADQAQAVHYAQGTWTRCAVGDSVIVWRITGKANDTYALTYDNATGVGFVGIYRFIGDSFRLIDRTTYYDGKFEAGNFWISGDRIYSAWGSIRSATMTSGGGIDTSSWVSDLVFPSGYAESSFYHTDKDVWLVGNPNLLYHYNGTTWQDISIAVGGNPVRSGEYSAAWTDGKQIFVCDKENGIIYHGR